MTLCRYLVLSCLVLGCLWLAFVPDVETLGQESDSPTRVVRIGAVSSGAKTKAFENLALVLTRKGFPAEYKPFSSYDALVDALDDEKIDIAWNSPLSHVEFHLRNECQSQTLAMREGDVGLRVTLITTGNSKIKSLDDLKGKRVLVGRQRYQEGLLSMHFLKKQISEFDQVETVQLAEKDAEGRRADTTAHILQALADGRGDAAVVPLGAWRRAVEWRKENPQFQTVWESPEFNHCVFTAGIEFNPTLGRQFTKLMTTLDPQDPFVAEFNRLEGTRRWLQGDSQGFESLVEAIQESE